MRSSTKPTQADEPAERPAKQISPAKGEPSSWLGPAFFIMCAGLALQATAGVASRDGDAWADGLFWFSLVVVFMPAALIVLSAKSCRRDRVSITTFLGIALMISRLMLYPKDFVYYDETMHLNTLRLLQEDHRLFLHINPLLRVSSYYPGLELATSGVIAVTHLSTHMAGIVVLLMARVLLSLSLVLVVEQVARDDRVACMAGLIYICNPQYLYYNSQFAYETLAIPLGLLAVYFLVSRDKVHTWGVLPAILCVAAVVVTHHLTSMVFMIGFLLWWLIERRLNGKSGESRALGIVTLVGVLLTVAWFFVSGTVVAWYLYGVGKYGVVQSWDVLTGRQARELFTDPSGDRTPLWEEALAVGSVAVIMLSLFPGVRFAWKYGRRIALSLLLISTGLLYPIIPLGHLSAAAGEITDRSAGFVFVGVVFVLAWWFANAKWPHDRFGFIAITAVLALLLLGGTISGSGPGWLETPGPYEVSADNRSVDTTSIEAAQWAAAHLSRNNRVLSDRINGALWAEIGHQYAVITVWGNGDPWPVLYDDTFTDYDMRVIVDSPIDYIVVDRRLSTGLPKSGVYFQEGEVGSENRKKPISPQALAKFEELRGAKRIYDNGSIVVYDVRGVH